VRIPPLRSHYVFMSPQAVRIPRTLRAPRNCSTCALLAPVIVTLLSALPARGQPAKMVCTPGSLTFQYRIGDPDPPPQTVSVSSPVPYMISVYSDPLTIASGGWLVVSRTSDQLLTVYARPRGYLPRSYAGRIVLDPHLPHTPTVTVSVGLTVTSQPLLTVSPASLRFSYDTWRSVPWLEYVFTGCQGVAALDWIAAVTSAASWVSLPKPRGTAGAAKPGAEQQRFSQNLLPLSIDPTSLTPGEYRAVVTVTAPGSANSPVSVPVTLVMPPPPPLVIKPPSIELEVEQRTAPVSRTVEISNPGLPLTYTAAATSSGNWLSVTPDGGQTPANLTMSVNAVALVIGRYQGTINFSVPGATRVQSLPINLSVKPPSMAATIAENGVVNAASFAPEITSGCWFTIFGSSLSLSTRMWNASDFVGDRMPISLDGTGVEVNDRPAAIQFISAGQINAQAPDDLATGPVTVRITSPRGLIATVKVVLKAYAPGFFAFQIGNRRFAAAVHLDGSTVANPDPLTGSAVRPAKPGDTILLFGTGFGPTNPVVESGRLFAGAAALANPEALSIELGGVPMAIRFAGLSAAGLYQFNVSVPDLPDGDHELSARLAGASTQPGIYICVRR